jgi:hypothetical protein
MDVTATILVVALLATPFLLALATWRWRKAISRAEAAEERIEQLEQRFAGIVDADAEEARIRAQIADANCELHELKASYLEKKAIYDRLLQEIAIFDERLSFAEMGVYEPHFEFTDSEEYKEAIQAVRELQKEMVSAKDYGDSLLNPQIGLSSVATAPAPRSRRREARRRSGSRGCPRPASTRRGRTWPGCASS